jgi:hypothetical protein
MDGTPDVLIVGAGAAGLACGRRLAECGVPFRILERADRAGGRLNQAFPVLLTAGPETRRLLDLEALQLTPFPRSVQVRFGGRLHHMADPRFEPLAAAQSLWNPIGSLRDKLRMLHFARLLEHDPAAVEDRLTLDLLRWNGRFNPAMIDRFFRPLAGWLFHDRSLAVSSRLFRFALRMVLDGPMAVPTKGMSAIADQLVERLPSGSVRLNATVERIGHREVTLAGGEVLRTRAVIDATTPSEVSTAACTTYTFAAERIPIHAPVLMLNGESGPINHLAVVSGSQIVAAMLGDLEEAAVRSQLGEWFGPEAARWPLLDAHRSLLPDMTAGTPDPWQRPVRVNPGHYRCGPHVDNPTLDGEFTSGFRAAQAAMDDLHHKRT